MAQTSEAKTFVAAHVEVGDEVDALTAISGQFSALNVSGGAGNLAEGYTADGDSAIIKAGKKEPLRVEVRFWYTEEAGEAFEVVYAIYNTVAREMYIRYMPLGDVETQNQFTSAQNGAAAVGVIEDFVYPGGDVQGSELIPAGFTLACSELLKEPVPAAV